MYVHYRYRLLIIVYSVTLTNKLIIIMIKY